jgi:WD40 repeat protein
VAANNDCSVRIFDIEYFDLLKHYVFPWSVNSVSVSPKGGLFAVLGDHEDGLVVDPKCGKAIGALKGHLDYSFASAWHPDGNILATGSQDTTCRLWDIRNLSESVAVLGGRMGSIRCIKFSSDGRFLATAEPVDFVHIYDSYADYGRSHEIDLFGEIAGLSFSPDAEALYVGIADPTYGGLIEFNRRHQHHYLNCMW